MASFLSIANHPFKKLENIYHELTVASLENIYNELIAKREAYEEYLEKQKKKKRRKSKKKPKEQFV